MTVLIIIGIVVAAIGILIAITSWFNKTDGIVIALTGLAILAGVLAGWLDTQFVEAKEVQDTWICEEYQEYIYEICDQYYVSPELIMAIVETESSGKANVSNGKCIGLMQVSSKWHRNRMKKLGVTDLYDPYSNILVGVDYLMELAAEYEDLPLVLMIYNGSSDAMKRYENGNYTSYAKSIMARAEELTDLHDEDIPIPIPFPDDIMTLKNLLREERKCDYATYAPL